MRLLYLLPIICTSAVPLQASRPIGAVVRSADYDSAKGLTVVHVVNTSTKEITGIGFSFQVVLADGSLTDRGYYGLDFLQGVIQGKGGIASGATYDVEFSGQRGPVQAMVDTVVYADGSAAVLSDINFLHISADRKGRLAAWQKINEVLNNALSDPHPNARATTQLRSLLAATKAKPSDGSSAAEASNVGFQLELQTAILNTSHLQSADDLRTLIKMNSECISTAMHHVSLTAN